MSEATTTPLKSSSLSTDRVIDVLELLAGSDGPLTLAEVAEGLGVHRSVAYRVLRSLTERRAVTYADGRYQLGVLMLILANAVPNDLRSVSLNELTHLSEQFGVTTFITLEDGGRSVSFQTVEPQTQSPVVTFRPGVWGPMDTGAPAIAILAGRTPSDQDSSEVEAARTRGYAVSSGTPGIQWVASPIHTEGMECTASVGALFAASSLDPGEIGEALRESSARISGQLGPRPLAH